MNYRHCNKKLEHLFLDLGYAPPSKQDKYLPGSHIPIFSPEYIKETKPDYLLILPWNIAGEVKEELSFISAWEGKFVNDIPELHICQ
jgi:hypothetical protein